MMRLPEDDEDEPLHAQADLFQYVCAGLLFAGLVGYAAYLNHSEGTAALCAKAGLQDAHGALAEKLCRGGKLHVSGDELLAELIHSRAAPRRLFEQCNQRDACGDRMAQLTKTVL